MRRIYWASVLIYAAVLVVLAALLPDRVPAHFGPSGDVDRWASRAAFVVAMAVVGGGLTVLFGLCGRLIRTSDLHSPWVSVPHRSWWTATPEREHRVRRMLEGDMAGMAAATMLFLSLLLIATLRASHLDEPRLGPAVWVLLAVYVVGLTVWVAWMYAARYRPQEES